MITFYVYAKFGQVNGTPRPPLDPPLYTGGNCNSSCSGRVNGVVHVQMVENAPDLSRISPEEVKKYVDNQMRRQTHIITFIIRLVDRLTVFLYISIIYRYTSIIQVNDALIGCCYATVMKYVRQLCLLLAQICILNSRTECTALLSS